MKNCKGFTLIEVITALMVLTITTTILVPVLVIMYDERLSIKQEHQAMLLLDQVITEWIYENNHFHENEIQQDFTTYTFSFPSYDDQKITACISWIGVNGRDYERCEGGKR